MAAKLLVVLAVIYAVDCHVIKSTNELLPVERIVIDDILKPYSDLTFGDSSGKRVYRKTEVAPPAVSAKQPENKDDAKKDYVPQLENRFGIRGGTCPSGYVQRGGFCFPDYD